MNIKIFIDKNHEKILLFSVIIAFLSSIIPFGYNAFIVWMVLTSAEVMIAWSFCVLSIGAASVAFYTVLMKKSLFYPMLYVGFHLILSIVLCVIEPLWIPLPIICVLGLIAAKKSTNPERRFRPHLINSRAAICIAICIFSVSVPIFVNFNSIPTQEYVLEPLYQDAPRDVEISLTLANLTRAETGPNGLLTILDNINALPHINVSVVAGFLEEFVMNTTLLIGREFQEQGTFIKPYSYYNGNWSAYDEDVKAFESFWNGFTHDVRNAVFSLSYEQLLTNDSLYATSGLYYDQIKAFADHNIAVDLMPLVEREVYINDYTMERINKTITIMKRWLSINDLPHRGVVIDTERMWGNDLETIMDYHKKDFHDVATAQLGRMIKDLKLFEWTDKGLDVLYGEYTKEKWHQYAIETRKSMVASATFGLHVLDLFDNDDSQQNLFKIAILPEGVKDNDDMAEFDFVGIMTYENGENSEHAVYGYCKSGDYFFGERCVPYIYSGLDNMEDYVDQPEKYVDNLERKFRIMRNYGYQTIGMWALTNIHCFSDWKEGWCGGMFDFTRAFGGASAIYEMCQRLEASWNDTISFTCKSANYALTTTAVSLLDQFLSGRIRYSSWPIEVELNNRLRPELFDKTYDIIDMILRFAIIMAFTFFALYLYMLSQKSKDIENKSKFHLCFSLFFGFTALNFLTTELELQFAIYPDIIPKNTQMWLTNPMNSDIFLILFILLSGIPMLYGLEKFILTKKRFILTQMAVIGLILMGLILIWHDYLPFLNAVILYSWLVLGLLLLRTVFVYALIGWKSAGPIRELAIIMGIGFILLLVGTMGTGNFSPILTIPGEVLGHLVVFVAVGLLFKGVLKMT